MHTPSCIIRREMRTVWKCENVPLVCESECIFHFNLRTCESASIDSGAAAQWSAGSQSTIRFWWCNACSQLLLSAVIASGRKRAQSKSFLPSARCLFRRRLLLAFLSLAIAPPLRWLRLSASADADHAVLALYASPPLREDEINVLCRRDALYILLCALLASPKRALALY